MQSALGDAAADPAAAAACSFAAAGVAPVVPVALAALAPAASVSSLAEEIATVLRNIVTPDSVERPGQKKANEHHIQGGTT